MIFCVEDDGAIRDLMIYTLHAAGFEATGFDGGPAFWEAIRTERPELILLDIMLSGEDGLSILRTLRTQSVTADIPVILATAKGTEYDKVTGLDLGADDYLAKPFGMMEMISRVKAVLRRAAPAAPSKSLRVGGLELNLDAHTVLVNESRVQLTLKEYMLLRTLMEHLGRVFTRDQLLELVWGIGYIGETRTVDVHIASLRTKLGPCGSLIETVRGVGYRMEASL